VSNLIKELQQKNLLHLPSWFLENTMYLTITGSIAYGVTEDTSDFDIYGYAIPPKNVCFPHLAGEIPGFGTPKQRFEQYTQHNIFDSEAVGGKGRKYDFTIFNIIKYFNLCMQGNPNILDSLFVPQSCIIHSTTISEMVRDNRKLFLSKAIWPRFKGYAYNQLHKASGKNPEIGSKRHKLREKYCVQSSQCKWLQSNGFARQNRFK
jgi:uncharacterized protein